MQDQQIQYPSYDALTMAPMLSQQQYDNFICKVALGTVPKSKFSDKEKTLPLTTECWDWQGYRNKRGYGQSGFGTPSRTGRSNRVSAYIAGLTGIKSISENDKVLHRCDNPACCNPDHFFIGTHKNNMDDMVDKGRQATGEEHGSAKLTWEQVATIRERYAAGNTTQEQLGEEYDVTDRGIGHIIHNDRWVDPEYTPPTKRAQSPIVILTAEQRAEVVALYQQGNTSTRKLGKLYSVSKTTISNIIKGQ